MKITQDLILDASTEKAFKIVYAKQNDENSRVLRISIFAATYPEMDSEVIFYATRENGQVGTSAGTVNEDKTLTVPIPSWALQAEGKHTCSITVDKDGVRRFTLHFTLMVEKE